ncbi:hypothetical protein HDV00_008561 [Rhizophlyctis rosea]|nr:hypothetical protein HDV00_008561 [Rhizophlyctis rosea]
MRSQAILQAALLLAAVFTANALSIPNQLIRRQRLSTDIFNYAEIAAKASPELYPLQKRNTDDTVVVRLPYRGQFFEINLRPHTDLFAPSYPASNSVLSNAEFFTGFVTGFPNSIVRATKYSSGALEGSAVFGTQELDTLHFEGAEKFIGKKGAGQTIVYHSLDVKGRNGMSKRATQTTDDALNKLVDAIAAAVVEALQQQLKNITLTPTAAEPTASVEATSTAGEETESATAPEPTLAPSPNIPKTRTTKSGKTTTTAATRKTTSKSPATSSSVSRTSTTVTAKSTPTPNLKTCNLAAIATTSFAELHDSPHAYMASLISSVSSQFESQLGLRLAIKYTYAMSNATRLNITTSSDPMHAQTAINFANDVASAIPQINDDPSVCATFVFTSAPFQAPTIGVAYTNSLCTPKQYATSASDNNGRFTFSEYTSVVMHELGHVFGSEHDTEVSATLAKSEMCLPKNKFTMFPAIQTSSSNAHRFSECSIMQIKSLMDTTTSKCWMGEAAKAANASGNGVEQLVDPPAIKLAVD